jgi:hypothetical protein
MNNDRLPVETQQNAPPPPSPAGVNRGKEPHADAAARAGKLATGDKPGAGDESRPKDITSLRADIAKLARAETPDEGVLKLIDFANEHVSKLELWYEQESRGAVRELKSARDEVRELAEMREPLDWKKASATGKAVASGVADKVRSALTAGRAFHKALAELPEIYRETAEFYRAKGTADGLRMAELLERRAAAVGDKARLPAPDDAPLRSLPALATFFDEFETTFGRDPKAVARLSNPGPDGEEALLRARLRELDAVIARLIGSLTGGFAAPGAPVGVTDQQQETFPICDVVWYGERIGDRSDGWHEMLQLDRGGTYRRGYRRFDRRAGCFTDPSGEQGRFTLAGDRLSFWDGNRLLERGHVWFDADRVLVLDLDLSSAVHPAADLVRYLPMAAATEQNRQVLHRWFSGLGGPIPSPHDRR